MQIVLEKASGRSICRNHLCSKNPEYINKGRIKSGTMCAVFVMSSASGTNLSYYCRACIEDIYLQMKKILNPDLWTLQ